MMNRKYLRVTLLAALLLAILLSVTGGTIAWFTDSLESASNVIESGNLDIEVEYTLDGKTWNNLDGATDLFQKDLWEPGHTEVVALKIKNAGSLALKYKAKMDIWSETIGKTKDGTDIVLSDILTVRTLTFSDAGVDDVFGFNIAEKSIEEAFKNENGIAYDAAVWFKNGNILENDKNLLPGEVDYVAIKVDMAETVGNEANHNGKDIPSIQFGLDVYAAQYMYETDSFGKEYDEEATYSDAIKVWNGTQDKAWFDAEKAAAATAENPVVFTVDTAEEFAGFINLANTNSFKNVTVKLDTDLDLGNFNWNEGGALAAYGPAFSGTLDGNGHTIKNLTAQNNWTYANAMFRTIGHDATFKNLVFEDTKIDNGAGIGKNKEYAVIVGIVGGGTVTFENITFNNCSVTAKNSAGLLVGGMTEGAIHVKNCKINNTHITVTDAGGKGGAYLGDGWSHHDYDYAGMYVDTASVIGPECTLTVADNAPVALPAYNYVK